MYAWKLWGHWSFFEKKKLRQGEENERKRRKIDSLSNEKDMYFSSAKQT